MATDKTLPNLELPGIPAAKKRGRPSTGNAMTPAQRKAEQRARDMNAMIEETNLNNVTDTGLIAMLGMSKKMPGGPNGMPARLVWEELGRRRGFTS